MSVTDKEVSNTYQTKSTDKGRAYSCVGFSCEGLMVPDCLNTKLEEKQKCYCQSSFHFRFEKNRTKIFTTANRSEGCLHYQPNRTPNNIRHTENNKTFFEGKQLCQKHTCRRLANNSFTSGLHACFAVVNAFVQTDDSSSIFERFLFKGIVLLALQA